MVLRDCAVNVVVAVAVAVVVAVTLVVPVLVNESSVKGVENAASVATPTTKTMPIAITAATMDTPLRLLKWRFLVHLAVDPNPTCCEWANSAKTGSVVATWHIWA